MMCSHYNHSKKIKFFWNEDIGNVKKIMAQAESIWIPGQPKQLADAFDSVTRGIYSPIGMSLA
jgi:hypothetical protein